jgi:hypothetical protein
MGVSSGDPSFSGLGWYTKSSDGYEEMISCRDLGDRGRIWMEEKRAGWLASFILSGDHIHNFFLDWRYGLVFFF